MINCIICLLTSDDPYVAITICGHVFHRVCLLKWFENSKNCPTCRESFTLVNLVELKCDFLDVSHQDEELRKKKSELKSIKDKLEKLEIEEKEGSETCNIVLNEAITLAESNKKLEEDHVQQIQSYVEQISELTAENIALQRFLSEQID